MVTVSMVSYPPESAVEITKRFFKLSPMPDFVTVVGPYTITELEGGIQASPFINTIKQRQAKPTKLLPMLIWLSMMLQDIDTH